jgi:hypothetical protein
MGWDGPGWGSTALPASAAHAVLVLAAALFYLLLECCPPAGPLRPACRCTITQAPPSSPGTCPFMSAGLAMVSCSAQHSVRCALLSFPTAVAAAQYLSSGGNALACCHSILNSEWLTLPPHCTALYCCCRQALRPPGGCNAAQAPGGKPQPQAVSDAAALDRRSGGARSMSRHTGITLR